MAPSLRFLLFSPSRPFLDLPGYVRRHLELKESRIAELEAFILRREGVQEPPRFDLACRRVPESDEVSSLRQEVLRLRSDNSRLTEELEQLRRGGGDGKEHSEGAGAGVRQVSSSAPAATGTREAPAMQPTLRVSAGPRLSPLPCPLPPTGPTLGRRWRHPRRACCLATPWSTRDGRLLPVAIS